MMTQEEKRAAYYKTPQRLHVYESSDKAKQIVQKSITIDTLFSGVVPIQWSTPQAPEFTGLTWFVRKYGEITSAFHGGTYIGYRTFLQLIPDHDFAVIVLTNSDRGVEAYPAVADAMVSAFTKLEPHTAVAKGVDPSVLDPLRFSHRIFIRSNAVPGS